MKHYSQTVRNIKFPLGLVITLFVLLRLFIVIFLNDGKDYEYIICQTVFTIAWAAVALFMFYCSLMFIKQSFTEEQNMRMGKVSFYVMLACVARVIVYAIYKWPILSYDAEKNIFFMWPSIHNIIEEVVWILLACFFYSYYKVRMIHKNNYSK